MNLYEISVVDGKGITHKSKVYEINVDAAFKEAFIQGKIYGAEKLDDCTVQQIQTNAGVSKDTEREYLGRIKNILDALGPNSYCAMAFEGCVGDAEENIDNDFAVSMKGRWQTECNYYCSMCCPIGRQNVKPCAVQEFDRVMMQALAALQGTDKISAAIISIAQDGRVNPGEDVQMGEILAYMKNVATAAEAMQLWIKKNLKGEACNGKKQENRPGAFQNGAR